MWGRKVRKSRLFFLMLILCFSFVPFFIWLDGFILCLYSLFVVFVNALFGFDLWLPCFSSMLTPSYICLLQPDSHIVSNTFLKKRVQIFLLSFPTFYDFEVLFKHLHVYPFAVPCVYRCLYKRVFFPLVPYTGLFK